MAEAMASKDTAEWLSTGAAARRLGVCPATLRRLAKDGRVDAYRLPTGYFRFNVAAELEKGRERLAARSKAQQAKANPEVPSA